MSFEEGTREIETALHTLLEAIHGNEGDRSREGRRDLKVVNMDEIAEGEYNHMIRDPVWAALRLGIRRMGEHLFERVGSTARMRPIAQRIAGKAEEVRRSDERSTIIAALKGASEPLTARQITDLCGMNYDAGRKMLTRMAHAGEIDKAGRGLFKLASLNPLSQTSQHPNAEGEEG
jgi:hypothetical protein